MPGVQSGQPAGPGPAGSNWDAAERPREGDANPAASWIALADAGLDGLSPPEAARVLHELGAERQRFLGLLCRLADWPARSIVGPRVPLPREVAALGALPGQWRTVVLPEDEAALGLAGLAFERVFVLDALWDCRPILYGAWHTAGVDPSHVRQVGERALTLLRAGALLQIGAAGLAPDYLPRSWDPFPFPPRSDAADTGARKAWAMARALTLVYWADRFDAAIAVAVPEIAASLRELLRPYAGATLSLPELASLEDVAACRGDELRQLQAVWEQAHRARAGESAAAVAAALEQIESRVEGARTRHWAIGFGTATLPMPSTVLIRVRSGRGAHDDSDYGAVHLARVPLCLLPADAGRPRVEPWVPQPR